MKGSHKILIVDDEPYNSLVLKVKFENAGYKVVTASNGIDGLNKFKLEDPDVVITDIKMPVMDGKEMCRSLKEVNRGVSCLIIVITGAADKEERFWVKEIDNACLVEKPVSPSRLLTIVEKYLRSPSGAFRARTYRV